MSRFVRPETVRLELSGGDWLLVKKRLTIGEERAAQARMYIPGSDGKLHVNPLQVGPTLLCAYLIDWSLTDDDGQPVAIRGLSPDALMAVLDNLDPEDFAEIRRAIEQHENAIEAARLEEKKRRAGASNGAATSPSPSAAAGVLTGFVN